MPGLDPTGSTPFPLPPGAQLGTPAPRPASTGEGGRPACLSGTQLLLWRRPGALQVSVKLAVLLSGGSSGLLSAAPSPSARLRASASSTGAQKPNGNPTPPLTHTREHTHTHSFLSSLLSQSNSPPPVLRTPAPQRLPSGALPPSPTWTQTPRVSTTCHSQPKRHLPLCSPVSRSHPSQSVLLSKGRGPTCGDRQASEPKVTSHPPARIGSCPALRPGRLLCARPCAGCPAPPPPRPLASRLREHVRPCDFKGHNTFNLQPKLSTPDAS